MPTLWEDIEPDIEVDACQECGLPLRYPMTHGLREGWRDKVFHHYSGGGVHVTCWMRWQL